MKHPTGRQICSLLKVADVGIGMDTVGEHEQRKSCQFSPGPLPAAAPRQDVEYV